MLSDKRRQRVCSCNCPEPNSTNTYGLYFEAYRYKKGILKDWETNVHGDPWNNMAPNVSHPALARDFEFVNDRKFNSEIPGFQSSDQ